MTKKMGGIVIHVSVCKWEEQIWESISGGGVADIPQIPHPLFPCALISLSFTPFRLIFPSSSSFSLSLVRAQGE